MRSRTWKVTRTLVVFLVVLLPGSRLTAGAGEPIVVAEMVRVPAGVFLMGSDDGLWDEKPPHRVYLDSFYIDRFEVTNGLYKRFMETAGRQAPQYWSDSRLNGASQAVVGVTWYDAEAYCHWIGNRLPTEAEWEKAARGTNGRKYPWGDKWDPTRAMLGENSLRTPVGSYAGGVSPYGIHDMAGNVAEWIADWYDERYYRHSPDRNPRGPESGRYRVLRGGSWRSVPFDLRTTDRNHDTPRSLSDVIGFRCAKSSVVTR